MNKNLLIASAVAAALGASAAAQAQVAACASPTYKMYVAGSSAAKASFQTALANDLFTTETSYSSSNGDFEAFCGPIKSPSPVSGLTAGAYAIVFYRAEGGSVVGALPIANGKNVKFLDLTGTNCNTSLTPATTGTSATVGTTDGWGGCVTTHNVEMGVTDVEPTAFTASAGNYPTAYSTSVFGPSNDFTKLAPTPLFQQVFAVAVNTNGINSGGVGQAINLSKETVAAILSGSYTDWSAVPSASGGAVSSSSQPITVINREAGSGTRTGTSIYFLGQECTFFPLALADNLGTSVSANTVDFYATSDELKAASTVPGSISYASIDNLEPNGTKYPNLTMVSLSGTTPTNLAAASGQYDFWFEATAIPGTFDSTAASSLYTYFTGSEFVNVATAPHAADINVIPNVGTNTATVPLTSSTVSGKTIYVNAFTRSGNSCVFPAEQN